MAARRNDPSTQLQLRIGDAERDRTIELLREHLVAGRLDADEFTTRMEAALKARTGAELAALLTDLPQDPNAVGGQTRWKATPRPHTPTTGINWMFVIAVVTTVIGLLVFVGNLYPALRDQDFYNTVGVTTGAVIALLGAAAAILIRHLRALPAPPRAPPLER
ncbi:MAG: DUF1707 domain-containing protein [Propionibacteriaceae bacterium]|jgi:uncharacterized membrane protein|nr:DUF1707 domain-containing protein [Propionibacteriaceae bacterium]